jgi:phage gp46-like protein
MGEVRARTDLRWTNQANKESSRLITIEREKDSGRVDPKAKRYELDTSGSSIAV